MHLTRGEQISQRVRKPLHRGRYQAAEAPFESTDIGSEDFQANEKIRRVIETEGNDAGLGHQR